MPDNEEKPTKPKNITIPRDLFVQLRDTIRTTDEDCRCHDRVLHDATIAKVRDAVLALNRFADDRSTI